MKKPLFLFVAAITLFSCSSETDRKIAGAVKKALLSEYPDNMDLTIDTLKISNSKHISEHEMITRAINHCEERKKELTDNMHEDSVAMAERIKRYRQHAIKFDSFFIRDEIQRYSRNVAFIHTFDKLEDSLTAKLSHEDNQHKNCLLMDIYYVISTSTVDVPSVSVSGTVCLDENYNMIWAK